MQQDTCALDKRQGEYVTFFFQLDGMINIGSLFQRQGK